MKCLCISNFNASAYWLGLLEGVLVMGVELVIGHEIAKTCGGSLQVWALTLAGVMSGLALGYAWSAMGLTRLTSIHPVRLASLGMICVTVGYCLHCSGILTVQENIDRATLMVTLMILPGMTLFGQILPSILNLSNQVIPGKLFAFATLGGLATALLAGFVLFDSFHPSRILSSMVLIVMVFCLLWDGFKTNGWVHFILGVVSFASLNFVHRPPSAIWHSENFYGIVEIEDEAQSGIRSLNFNGLPQTVVSIDDTCSVLPYVNQIAVMGSVYPAGSRSLVLGVGGGTVLRALDELGHQTEACEWNPGIVDASLKWFQPKAVKWTVDDARHHIRRLQGTYQFMVLDCFFGEQPPWHVLTLESLKELQAHLVPGGMAIIYFPRDLGNEDLGSKLLVNTLLKAGFCVAGLSPSQGQNTGQIFIATLKKFDYASFPPFRLTACTEKAGMDSRIPYRILEGYPEVGFFDDDHPVLERLKTGMHALR